MTNHAREYARLERELIKLGLDTKPTARGGFSARLPNGTTVHFIHSVDPSALDKQRKQVIAAGLEWPLDPKPRAPRAPRPKPAPPVETETAVVTPKNMEVISVNPELAEKWLEKNTSNRRLSDSVVERYANLMTQGLWHYDGSPIRFDTGGKLIDGQHRLWAVIESDTTQEFIVLRNLDPRAFITIDTGKGRSFSDILSIEHPGIKNLTQVAAMTQLLYRWEVRGVRNRLLRSTGGGPQNTIPTEELLQFYNDNSERLTVGARNGHARAQRIKGLGTAVVGVLSVLYSEIDEDDADYFFSRLADGIGLDEDSPILALRNHLANYLAQTGGDVRNAMPAEVGMGTVTKAWNAYRRGEPMKRLIYRTGGAKPESFPEPI